MKLTKVVPQNSKFKIQNSIFNPMQLRTKTILFLSALLIFLATLVIFYLQYSVRPGFGDQVIVNLQRIVQENKAVYYTYVEGLKIRTVDWSSDNHIKELAERIVDRALVQSERNRAAKQLGVYLRERKMQYDPFVVIVDLLDKDGVVVASSNAKRIGIDELENEILLNGHFFSKAINSGIGEAFSRGIILDKDAGSEPIFHITSRLLSTKLDVEGRFVPLPAVLLVHFSSLQDISDVMSQAGKLVFTVPGREKTKATSKLETYIVNGKGIILADTYTGEDKGSLESKSSLSPLFEMCSAGQEDGIAEYINHRGVLVLGAVACLSDDGIAIITEQESFSAYAVYNDLIKRTIIVGGVVFIAVFLIVFFVISIPMLRLSKVTVVAEKVSTGDFTLRVPPAGKDEIGRLGGAVNTMLDTIESSFEKQKGQALIMEKDINQHEKQEKFLGESKRAQLNLLEDAWQIKEKLEVEKARLNTILASIGDGLILIDGQYKITLTNKRVTEMFGMSDKELLGRDLRAVVKLWKKRKDEISAEKWPIEDAMVDKNVVTVGLEDDLSITTENKKEHTPIAFSAAPLGGELAGAVIVFRDVTDDRELDDAKSGFISIASHQLRTPLTTIRWYSEMLLSGDAGVLTPSQRDFLDEIHGGAERLYQTIDLLLGISRVESGKIKLEKVPINLTEITEDIAKELRQQIDIKKIIFTTIPPEGDDVIVMLDSITLRQVILNLFSNSIRYTNAGGTIEASWSINESKSNVTYSVRDNGIGIPVSQHGRIFSKFFRAENALQKAPDGSGLGLALVKEVVASWGGKVWFETAEGKGTTFYFTIPIDGVL